MKAVFKILTILLLCALFVGCASASGFSVSSGAEVTPSGVLQVGDKVTATVTLTLPPDKQTRTQEFTFKSDLKNPSWTIYVNDGIRDITHFSRGGSLGDSLPGSRVYYDYPVYLRIEMMASVSNDLVNKDVTPVIILLETVDSVVSSYSSPTQYVYNKANFPNDVNARKSALSQIQTSINSYASSGVNTAEAQSIASKANENILTAENLGVDSLTSALASLDAADKNIAAAKESLNYAILNYVAEQINVLNSDVNTLNALGASDKATMVSVSTNSLVMMYNTAAKSFETDKTGDYSSLYNSAESMIDIADSYIAQARAASASATPTPQPTQPSVVTPTQTAFYPTPTSNPTPVPTQALGKITFTLDGTTMILLIVIVVLIAGLFITVLLYHNAKSSGGKNKKQKKEKKDRDNDRWESL